MTARPSSGVAGHSHSTTTRRVPRRGRLSGLLLAVLLCVTTAACGGSGDPRAAADPAPLRISAIPDQDPERLARLHGQVARYLADELDVEVQYTPVVDYAAAVSLFRRGDLDLVWFGGLTGVQARLQTPGSQALAQRDIDADFHSVFIANSSAGLPALDEVADLRALRGKRFTFGSQSSTSGRLMPEYFLRQAGVDPRSDFAGPPGYSGSHDRTLDLVQSGSYQAGALNEQVWHARVAAGTVDASRVRVIWRTPGYADYHWLLGPGAADRYGDDFPARVRRALLALDPKDPESAAILSLFGAERFVETSNNNYEQIEEVGRQSGLIPAS